MIAAAGAWGDRSRLARLSLRLIAGRRYWLPLVFVLLWPLFQILWALMPDSGAEAFEPNDAQGRLIGLPLTVLAILLGGRIIAGEIDRRTLEIAYTVPGGTARVWLSKLAAAVGLLVACEVPLALAVVFFFTSFPLGALYGALQAAVFYLALSMALSTLFKSEATGALLAAGVLVLNGVFTGFGEVQVRISPFFNPAALPTADPSNLLAWTVQNRIGFALASAAVTALAFARAERREKML